VAARTVPRGWLPTLALTLPWALPLALPVLPVLPVARPRPLVLVLVLVPVLVPSLAAVLPFEAVAEPLEVARGVSCAGLGGRDGDLRRALCAPRKTRLLLGLVALVAVPAARPAVSTSMVLLHMLWVIGRG